MLTQLLSTTRLLADSDSVVFLHRQLKTVLKVLDCFVVHFLQVEMDCEREGFLIQIGSLIPTSST